MNNCPCHGCPEPPEACRHCAYLAGVSDTPSIYRPDPKPDPEINLCLRVREYNPQTTLTLMRQVVGSYRKRRLDKLNPELAARKLMLERVTYLPHPEYIA